MYFVLIHSSISLFSLSLATIHLSFLLTFSLSLSLLGWRFTIFWLYGPCPYPLSLGLCWRFSSMAAALLSCLVGSAWAETPQRRQQLWQAIHVREVGPDAHRQALHDELGSERVFWILLPQSWIRPARLSLPVRMSTKAYKKKKELLKHPHISKHRQNLIQIYKKKTRKKKESRFDAILDIIRVKLRAALYWKEKTNSRESFWRYVELPETLPFTNTQHLPRATTSRNYNYNIIIQSLLFI